MGSDPESCSCQSGCTACQQLLKYCFDFSFLCYFSAIRMARLMIEDGKLNYEDIAMYTELTLEEVEKIALEKKSA